MTSSDRRQRRVSVELNGPYKPLPTSPVRKLSSTSLPERLASRHPSGVSENSDDSLPKPPDGGWGWVVVVASFLTHVIADGSSFSIGVIFEELLSYFEESRAKIAWIGSLYVSIPLLSGPIASVLTNRYGCRVTAMTGGFITGLGLVLSSFANSVEMLCLTYGVMAGFGTALIFIPAVIVVAYYFEKKRAFATGLAVAGSGIGTALFAPLTQFLIASYSWKGAMLVLGGLTFNIVAFAGVFWPIETQSVNSHHSSLEKVSRWSSEGNVAMTTTVDVPSLPHAESLENADMSNASQFDRMLSEPMTQSLVLFPTYLQNDINGKSDDVIKQLTSNGEVTVRDILTQHNLLDMLCLKQSLTQMVVSVTGSLNRCEVKPNQKMDKYDITDDKDKLQRNGETACRPATGSRTLRVRRLPLNRQDIFYRGTLRSALSRPPSNRTVSCPDIIIHVKQIELEEEERCHCLNVWSELVKITRQTLDLSIFRSLVFIYFSFSCLLMYGAYDVPYMFAPDLSTDKKFGMNSAYVIAISGLTSTLAQVAIGYAGDQPGVNTMYLYTLLTILSGISTMFVPLSSVYWHLLVYGALYGFFISGVYSLTSIVLVDLFGMARLTNTYGICFTLQGIAGLIGPPIAGWIRDTTGNYNLTFLLCGLVMVISGLMLCFIPCIQRVDSKRLDDEVIGECSVTAHDI